MDWKKWVIRLGFGYLVYFLSTFIFGLFYSGAIGVLGGWIGIILIGTFSLWLASKIFESRFWSCEEEDD